MSKKTYTSEDFSASDLLYFGYSNLQAAEILFEEKKAHLLDSAGYLAYLAFELILKAWLIHLQGTFKENHNINRMLELIKDLDPAIKLNKKEERIFNYISHFKTLRYPNCPQPSNIGDGDFDIIKKLDDALWREMPDELKGAYKKINSTLKGNRALGE